MVKYCTFSRYFCVLRDTDALVSVSQITFRQPVDTRNFVDRRRVQLCLVMIAVPPALPRARSVDSDCRVIASSRCTLCAKGHVGLEHFVGFAISLQHAIVDLKVAPRRNPEIFIIICVTVVVDEFHLCAVRLFSYVSYFILIPIQGARIDGHLKLLCVDRFRARLVVPVW